MDTRGFSTTCCSARLHCFLFFFCKQSQSLSLSLSLTSYNLCVSARRTQIPNILISVSYMIHVSIYLSRYIFIFLRDSLSLSLSQERQRELSQVSPNKHHSVMSQKPLVFRISRTNPLPQMSLSLSLSLSLTHDPHSNSGQSPRPLIFFQFFFHFYTIFFLRFSIYVLCISSISNLCIY